MEKYFSYVKLKVEYHLFWGKEHFSESVLVEMKHIGEVSGSGENPRRSKKYSHFIYYTRPCEHVYLSFHAALSWLQWLSLTKLLPLRRHGYCHLSRDIHYYFISFKKNQYYISGLQYYIIRPCLPLKEIAMLVHLF